MMLLRKSTTRIMLSRRMMSSTQFVSRHIGPTAQDQDVMLKLLGFSSMRDLIDATVPESIRVRDPLKLPMGLSEHDALKTISDIGSKNIIPGTNAIGQGYHGTYTPSVILRNLVENPSWYTAYTPYQAELSQGRMEMLLNFQTMIADLTGMEVAGASLLDESTAAAEAMSMSNRLSKGKRHKYFVDTHVHPQTLDVILTRAAPIGIEVVVGDIEKDFKPDKSYCGVLVQYPNTTGEIYEDMASKMKDAKSHGLYITAASDPLSLTLLQPPGEWGADVVVGSAQRFGVPMFFGGPHAGFMATKEKFLRQMPGRVIGVSRDAQGNRALRMALATREQHIRRDKATSNICTAQALLANVAASYGIYHGPEGLVKIANRVRSLTATLRNALVSAGLNVRNKRFFDTIVVENTKLVHSKDNVVNLRHFENGDVGISLDETHDLDDVNRILKCFGVTTEVSSMSSSAESPERTSAFMTHPVFHSHRSETHMLRYLKSLETKDISLNHSMIPLGSCTMKLNATSEMIPVTNPQFANIHPFAPKDQTEGYETMIGQLSDWLCEITGFHAVSNQPNSGASGEYAGLLAISSYLKDKGEGDRNICLIPASAHGTNPASAVMAGMKVVVVKNKSNGEIDMEDLLKKADKHADRLAALMVTYPSTYGVFEEGIVEAIDIIHTRGGQVYMDGANMNAQVGLTSPGAIGADVCHLNLHKTFCIPHGGGGPGVGTIGVAKHLTPFLPGHVHEKSQGAIAGAQHGSAGILPISWMYIAMLGSEGLKNATENAILSANYMANRLKDDYDILFTGKNGQCAHEFIVDLRKFKSSAGIVEKDVAKRLGDYGFHSPTMSWPVGGTIMIEPTESEPKEELDRFCDALIAIREEIREIEDGEVDRENNLLVNAPHTASMIASDNWEFPYSRERAAFPTDEVKFNKFWPTVARLDDVFGDRNVICSCPTVDSYVDEDEAAVA